MALPSFLKLRGPDGQSSRVQDNISGQLQPLATALSATPILGGAAPPWVAPDLLNGFTNLGGVFAVAGYHRDCLRYVHAKGALQSAAGCAAGTVIATLPGGYRPSEYQRFVVVGTTGTFQYLTVSNTGAVSVGLLVAAGGTVDFNFSFLAEQ